jgi:hypothetical protein
MVEARLGLPQPAIRPGAIATENIRCYALIVGAGITGSLVAERLTRQGLDVVKILGLKSKFFPSRRSHYSPCTILIGSLRSISRACRRDSDSMSFALTYSMSFALT